MAEYRMSEEDRLLLTACYEHVYDFITDNDAILLSAAEKIVDLFHAGLLARGATRIDMGQRFLDQILADADSIDVPFPDVAKILRDVANRIQLRSLAFA
jgi:hypothetical protein